MKIGIISDTHFSNPESCQIPDWILNAFKGVDMIVHAGDAECRKAFDIFRNIAPVYEVRGNCDRFAHDTPEAISIEIGAGKLTVAHRPEVARRASGPDTKVLVYGHTHISLISQEQDLLVICPGSPTLPRGGLPASVALLSVENGKISAELKHP
jgi:hypothetical protein